jgi:hypothetical protein
MSTTEYIFTGGAYILQGGYNMMYYIGKLFTRPSEEELVKKGLAHLYQVRNTVTLREKHLREQVQHYTSKAVGFSTDNMNREAKVMIKLYMLYDAQVNYCQTTMTAIESHIISLESISLNKQVCWALKESNFINGFEAIEEEIIETAVEKLDDRNQSAGDFLRTLEEIPSITIDESDIERELKKLKIDTPDPNIVSTITYDNLLMQLPIVPTNPVIVTSKDTCINNNSSKQLIQEPA